MTLKDAKTILAFADGDMDTRLAANKAGRDPVSFALDLDTIRVRYEINPRSFYGLHRLVEMAVDCIADYDNKEKENENGNH